MKNMNILFHKYKNCQKTNKNIFTIQLVYNFAQKNKKPKKDNKASNTTSNNIDNNNDIINYQKKITENDEKLKIVKTNIITLKPSF